MKKTAKRIISVLLVVCLFCTATLPTFANAKEEYLADLRLIYADSYQDAVDSLADGEFSDYKVLNVNLNKDSGKQAVWLAYKTTTNVEDAITDVAVMQMNGGYNEGNYQEMLQESFEEYIEASEVYLQAVNYFIDAYNEGDYMAEVAFRQLNLYCDGVDHGGELLGNLFEEGLDAPELAKIFMQGNSYALTNIRSLLAMGVSYNEDGRSYLEHVEDAAALFAQDPAVFEEEEDFEDYDGLAAIISATILTFRDMFKELETVEDEIDLLDDEVTDTEFAYLESYSMAELMRGVDYPDGQTLYDFCLNFELDEEDLSSLYPLVYALNDGQVAMTRVSHYYNVVRYSVSETPPELLEEQLSDLEDQYADEPFDVYSGVDMSVFEGTFALTTAADRAEALTGEGYLSYLLEQHPLFTGISIGVGMVGLGALLFAVIRTRIETDVPDQAVDATEKVWSVLDNFQQYGNDLGSLPLGGFGADGSPIVSVSVINVNGETVLVDTCDQWANIMISKYVPNLKAPVETMTFQQKMELIDKAQGLSLSDSFNRQQIHYHVEKATLPGTGNQQAAEQSAQNLAGVSGGIGKLTASLYVVGGAMMLYMAISLGIARYNQRHPDYADIPVALVDLVNTQDGDRFVKYDAVLEAEPGEDGTYAPGDTNAFAGERWNALYFTKSYEAGQPLLADFVISHDNNKPGEGYTPVHRFGEIVSYDLNKYCFSSKADSVYLSVKQSENNKSAVEDVPSVIASLISGGTLFLAVGGGVFVGAGLTYAVQQISKKKKNKKEASSPVTGDDSGK